MKRFLLNFKKYRFLLDQLIIKEIKLKYRNSYLGVIWTMLEPLLTMVVLTLVFSRLLGKSTQDFPVYVLTGRLIFSFFSGSTKQALKAVRNHGGMIKKVYVPKYMYPLSAIFSNYFTFLISLIVLAAVAAVRHVVPTLRIFLAVIPLINILGLALGTGLVLSALAVFFRDLEYLWGIATMIIMYISAIFYNVSDVVSEANSWMFRFNPIYACIDNFRSAVFGTPLDVWYAGYSAAVAAILVFFGTFVFVKSQDRFILYL